MPMTLSEADSKAVLSSYSIPFAPEILVSDSSAAGEAADRLGFPVAIKLCGNNIAHKTERGLVRLGISTPVEAEEATAELLAAARPEDDATGVLISPMIAGEREFIAGLNNDAQFGPTVVFGVGGVLTEVLNDAVVRLAPITKLDAKEMVESLTHAALLGEFRGEPPVDVNTIVDILMSLSQLATDRSDIASVDLNPLIISKGQPVAVDALIELVDSGDSTEVSK